MPSDEEPDRLIGVARLRARHDISNTTLERRLRDRAINFPKPVMIAGRRYWRIGELEAWEKAQLRWGGSRAKPQAAATTDAPDQGKG